MSLLDSSPTSDELMSWEDLKALVAANGASIARLCAKLGVKVDAPRESTPPPTAPICVQGAVGALPVLVETPSTPALQPCIVPKPRPSTPTKCSMECLDDETCQVMPTLLRDLSFPTILLPPMRKGNEQHKWLPPTHMKVAEDNGERPRPWPSFVGRPCQELMLMTSPFFMTCHSGVHQKQFWPPPQGIPLKFVSEDMQEVLGCPVSSSALPMLSYGAKSYFQFKCFFPGSMKMMAQCLALLPSVNPAIYPPWRPPDRETHQAMIPGFPSVALSPNVHGDLSGWHSAFFHEKNDNGWLCVLHVLLSALAHFQWQIPWPSPQGCCAILSLWETYCSGHKLLKICGRPGPVMFFFVSNLGRILGGASLMSNFWSVQKQHHVPSLDEILPAHLLGLNAHQIPLPLSALFSRASADQMRLECSMVIFLQMFSTKRCLTQDVQEHWVGEEQLL